MKKGKFLIVNEPTAETVDMNLKVLAADCDIYPVQVYVPRSNQKMSMGFACVIASIAQMVFFGVMLYFFSYGFLPLILLELAFFVMYGKEHIWLLEAQLLYLVLLLFSSIIYLLVAFLPESSGTHQDFAFLIPTIPKGTLALLGTIIGILTCVRGVLIAEYRIQLFYSNLRDKFLSEKVVLQPVM